MGRPSPRPGGIYERVSVKWAAGNGQHARDLGLGIPLCLGGEVTANMNIGSKVRPERAVSLHQREEAAQGGLLETGGFYVIVT